MQLPLSLLCRGDVTILHVVRVYACQDVDAGLGYLVVFLGEAHSSLRQVLLEDGGGQDLLDVVQFFIVICGAPEAVLILLQETHYSFCG